MSPVEPRFSVTYHWFTYGAAADESNGHTPLKFDFLFGIDGISLSLIVLTTLLTVSCVLISWEAIQRSGGRVLCLPAAARSGACSACSRRSI